MLLEYHTIYQLGTVAVSAFTVKILTQPKARPLDWICDAVVLISAAIRFTEIGLILAGTIPP